jgi:DNA repair photolyase
MPRPHDNPQNRFHASHIEWDDDAVPLASLEIIEESPRGMLSTNRSPDLPFDHTVNPYRGCTHACAYCYARPYHEYWGFGAGTDFDRKIVVKVGAADALRAELIKGKHRGRPIMFSGATDPYQGLELRYGLTRACLEVCLELRASVSIITKSALIERDVALLSEIAKVATAEVFISVPFLDEADARAIEPFASKPSRRFEAMRALSDAAITTGISLSPMIPGLNDNAIPEILSRAHAAGATRAFMNLVRLPGATETVFVERLREAFPLRAEKVLNAIREVRGGSLSINRFGERMKGNGPRWAAIESLYRLHATRLGFQVARLEEAIAVGEPDKRVDAPGPRRSTAEKPRRQLKLFEE